MKAEKEYTYGSKIMVIYSDTDFCTETMSTGLDHNFFNIDPFLMIFAPFESSHSQLSNGAKIIKNGSILKMLWANQVDRISIHNVLYLIYSMTKNRFWTFWFFYVLFVFSGFYLVFSVFYSALWFCEFCVFYKCVH